MSKIAVIATSTGCLDYVDNKYDNLRILRMKIIMNEETFNDFIELTASDFYKRLEEDTSLVPSSSMPSIGELFELLEDLEKEGYEEVIITTISSELSGTYNVCLMAKNQYEGKLKIHVVDSRNAAITEGFLSLEALRLVEKKIPTLEIIEYLEKLRINRKQYFMVDNLRLFVANGRLSGASGFIGSMFKIKPILEVNEVGKIVSLEKIRTQKKSLARMADIILGDLEKVEDFIMTYISSDNLDGLRYMKSRIEEVYPNHKFIEAPITPVIGCHTGVGTVGVAFFNLGK
ncbi:MAG: DegV domain-containing protein [Candidatus Izimaplasma bacterium HR2]|nr:MAG: DegV domain-containing protein [Candidatus Izimaplasma bacterium HR2]